MQEHTGVRRRDGEFLTDFRGRHLHPLAQHERASLRRRQLIDAQLQDFEELRASERLVGRRPFARRRLVVPVGPEQRVLESIVRIAQGLDKQTIGEYVEDAETLDALRRVGVDYAQGFYVGRPRPVSELLARRAA